MVLACQRSFVLDSVFRGAFERVAWSLRQRRYGVSDLFLCNLAHEDRGVPI